MDDSKLVVVDEEGREIEMEIMFTFRDDRRNKSYVVYFDPNNEEEETTLFASIYDDEGHLIPIDSEEEWVMVEEVIESFMNEDQEEVDEMDVIDTEELPQ
ncbi:MAG: DUF1292 domain-containing protein [Bacilli bacterium]|jgi:uncharacterized protein YrzB (UPF0473 family)